MWTSDVSGSTPRKSDTKYLEKNWVIGIIVVFIVQLIIRYAISQFPYSGEFEPPKYGDFEVSLLTKLFFILLD
jgi:hypothetical protein